MGTAARVQDQAPAWSVRPLGDKVLVVPDPVPPHTASGLLTPHLVDPPAMSGRVHTLGDGPLRERRIKQAAVARCLALLDQADAEGSDPELVLHVARREMQAYMASAEAIGHVCAIGQRVVFAPGAGADIHLEHAGADPTWLIVIPEDSLLAVVETAQVPV